VFTKEDHAEVIQVIIRENRGITMPEFVEVYPLIDEMAEKLYHFISR